MTINVSTNYGTNKGSIQNILDGSTSTYWSANEAQNAGKYILFSFAEPVTFRGITATSGAANGTQITSGTSMQVSEDGLSWTDVGTFDGNKVCTISGITFKHVTAVRIYWNARNQKKLAFYEAALDYFEEKGFLRENGQWKQIQRILHKENGAWVENNDPCILQNSNMIIHRA